MDNPQATSSNLPPESRFDPRRYLPLLFGAGAIVVIDQFTKTLVRTRLALGESWAPIPELGQLLRIVHWNNTGAAFGLFPDGGAVFMVIAFVVTAGILYYFPRLGGSSRLLQLALILQLGGALGNLTDRLQHGPVTDFIAVGGIPVFNIADASISTGVAVLILTMWLDDRRQSQAEAELQNLGEQAG